MDPAEMQNVLRLQLPQAEPRLPLGALLHADGLLTVEQIEVALLEAERSGKRLGEVLLETGVISGVQLASALARQADLPFVDLREVEIDPEAAGLLPEKFARRYKALPLDFVDEDTVLVAVADPTNVIASDDLQLALGLHVQLAVVEAELLDGGGEIEEEGRFEDIREAATTSAPAIKLVNSIISMAVEEGASDVHFEPQHGELVVRARVAGVMRRLATGPKGLQAAVTSRLKIMGDLDITEKRAPQDGRLTVRFDGQPMDIRIAVIPTTYGEQVVLRILHRRTGRLGLGDLGMSPANQEVFARAIQQPYGAVIACGPTGSGKTTPLYAALDLLNDEGRVLMTIEDPVEYQIKGINQIEVNVRAGLTFARG